MLFLFELDDQRKLIERGIARLRESAEHWTKMHRGVDDGKRSPPIEIVERCANVLGATAGVKRVLYPCGRKDRRVIRRCELLRRLLDKPALPTIETLAVRDSWEHADERLDSMLAQRPRGISVSSLYVAAEDPAPDQITLRRFDPVAFAIHYRDDVLSLVELGKEASTIGDRVKHAYPRLMDNIVDLY